MLALLFTPCSDLTAATWGGSTVQSDEEEGSDDSASTASLVLTKPINTEGSQQAMGKTINFTEHFKLYCVSRQVQEPGKDDCP